MNTCSNCAFSEECRYSCSDDNVCESWMEIPKTNLGLLLIIGIGFWLCGLGMLFGIGKLLGVF